MISIIIPVKNGATYIQDCIKAALDQQALESKHEVIVVDDGSTDSTPQLVMDLGVRLLSQDNAGPASARNAGAAVARGEILAFTDADCIPDPHWLKYLAQPFDDPQVVGAKGTYRTRQSSLVARFVQQEYESKYTRMRQQAYIDFIDTYSAAYRRDVFLQNGGFDPAFPVPSVEDQEFSFRMARKGYRMVFAPQAVVYHHHDRILPEYFRRKYGIGYWKAFMLRWLPEKALTDSHTLPSQRWQILLLGFASGLALLTIVWPFAAWGALLGLSLFALTALPFLAQIALKDPPVLLAALPLLLLRALAQTVGLAVGFIFPPKAHPRLTAGLNLPSRVLKRALDIFGGLTGAILSLPVLLICALAVRLQDGGSAFFLQERAGENGKPFRVLKLRTMTRGAEQQVEQMLKETPLDEPVYKFLNDPRVTPLGRFLRRWSLDELPQFWNVLSGQMSLVGPRPEETWLVALYNDQQRQRLAFKPGLTGPMQISGRGALDMSSRLALELEYIQNYSFGRDLLILLCTPLAVIHGKGAF